MPRPGVEKISQVEVYAEGDVRLSGASDSARPAYRGAFRTTEVQLKCYDPRRPANGRKTLPGTCRSFAGRVFWHRNRPEPVKRPPATSRCPRRAWRKPGAIAGFGVAGFLGRRVARADASGCARFRADARGRASRSATGGPAIVRRNRAQARPDGPACRGSRRSGCQSGRCPAATSATADPQVQQARAPQVPGGGAQPPDIDLPPIEGTPEVQVPKLPTNPEDLPPNIEPLPAPDGSISVPELPRTRARRGGGQRRQDRPRRLPSCRFIGGFRTTSLFARSGRRLQIVQLPATPDGVNTYICRGGINIVTQTRQVRHDRHRGGRGRDLARARPQQGRTSRSGPTARPGSTTAGSRWRFTWKATWSCVRTNNKFAGKGDQRTVRAPRLYYDFLTDRLLAPNAEIDLFAPSLLAPVKIKSPRIEQFRRPIQLPNGTFVLADEPEIRAEPSTMTGSRFPDPGYKFNSQSIDLTRHTPPLTDPNTGKEVKKPKKPDEIPMIPRSPRIPTIPMRPRKSSSGGSMPVRTSTSRARSRSFTGRTSSWTSTTSSPRCA